MQLFAPFLLVLGISLQVLAIAALLAGVSELFPLQAEFTVFAYSALSYSVMGIIAITLGRNYQPSHLSPRHMFLTTAGTWFVLSIVATLPLVFSPLNLTFTDALFESISGLTTTGSTIFADIANLPHAVLLWRSILQWIGGIGVICMAVLLLPFLHVGGMRLFQTESSHWENGNNIPRTKSVILTIVNAYAALTLCCAIAYSVTGTPLFDAINHAMTTVSTGGFATTEHSFLYSNNATQWVAILFMLAGAIPFTLYPALASRNSTRLFKDQQVNGLLKVIIGLTAVLSAALIFMPKSAATPANWVDKVTLAAFNLVSVITTTGFASSNYAAWGTFACALFLFATFIGGCSGSTSGGIKVFRFQIFFSLMRAQLARSVHPRMTITSSYAGKPIRDEIITALSAYFFLMMGALVLLTLILSLSDLDLLAAISGAATALMNVGPGLGDTIGPVGNFQSLPDFAKWALGVGMLLGRLEFLTIVILFTASYWRG